MDAFAGIEEETCFHIAKALEREQIPTPRAYLMDTYGKYHANELLIRKKQMDVRKGCLSWR